MAGLTGAKLSNRLDKRQALRVQKNRVFGFGERGNCAEGSPFVCHVASVMLPVEFCVFSGIVSGEVEYGE